MLKKFLVIIFSCFVVSNIVVTKGINLSKDYFCSNNDSFLAYEISFEQGSNNFVKFSSEQKEKIDEHRKNFSESFDKSSEDFFTNLQNTFQKCTLFRKIVEGIKIIFIVCGVIYLIISIKRKTDFKEIIIVCAISILVYLLVLFAVNMFNNFFP